MTRPRAATACLLASAALGLAVSLVVSYRHTGAGLGVTAEWVRALMSGAGPAAIVAIGVHAWSGHARTPWWVAYLSAALLAVAAFETWPVGQAVVWALGPAVLAVSVRLIPTLTTATPEGEK